MAGEQNNGQVISMTRTGYSFNTITLTSSGAQGLVSYLNQKIAPHQEAYKNIPVVIDVSKVNYLEDLNYPELCEICRGFGLILLGLSGAHTDERAKRLQAKGIPVVNSSRFARMREENTKPKVITQTFEVKVPVKVPVPDEVKVPYEVKVNEPLIVLNRNIRSGETISAAGNSVVVFGSVANGARIIASHNILIFGDLNGQVYAGSPKDESDPGYPQAFIFTAGLFNPTFVAIAGNYQTADDMDRDPFCGPIKGQNHALIVSLNGTSLCYRSTHDFMQHIQSSSKG